MLPLDELVRHLRQQRILLGLTQAQLAREAKTSQSLVAKLENGRLNPSYETVRKLSETLDRLSRREEPTATQLAQFAPVCAAADEPLGDALARMKEHGYSQLPVVDETGVPVGSLSERDVLEQIEAGQRLTDVRQRPVSDIMKGAFPTVAADTPRRTLVELLRGHDAVLVVRGGKLAGVVTRSDLW